MRVLDTATSLALSSSRPADTITVWAWYNGALAIPEPLDVNSWALSYDTTRQVQTLELTVADPDGSQTPWLPNDPLGVAGSRLQVFYNVGGAASIAYDWFRITEPQPAQKWRSYLVTDQGVQPVDSPQVPGMSRLYVSEGSPITLRADSLARNIANAKFLTPQSPPKSGSPTVVSEVKRLLADIMPVTVASGVVDHSVPSSLVYSDDRLNAVQDLCKRIGCDYRTTGAGTLEIYPIANLGPVWTLAPGVEGFEIDVLHEMKLDGLYNTFVVDGSAGQNAVRGYATIESGPLAPSGPHGSYPTFYSSQMIKATDEANAYAAQMRDTQLRGMTVSLTATCLPHPGLQQGDWITVQCPAPIPNGLATFPARIRTLDLGGRDGQVDPMKLGLDASYTDVAAIFGGSRV